MRLWYGIGLLVVVAALAAFGWHWVAADPGYVLLRLRGWKVETTVVAAVVILLVAWAVAHPAVAPVALALRRVFAAASTAQSATPG